MHRRNCSTHRRQSLTSTVVPRVYPSAASDPRPRRTRANSPSLGLRTRSFSSVPPFRDSGSVEQSRMAWPGRVARAQWGRFASPSTKSSHDTVVGQQSMNGEQLALASIVLNPTTPSIGPLHRKSHGQQLNTLDLSLFLFFCVVSAGDVSRAMSLRPWAESQRGALA